VSRLHEPRLELLIDEQAPAHGHRRWVLNSPCPGWFSALVKPTTWSIPGQPVGSLEVLGRAHLLVVPPGVAGAAERIVFVGEPAGDSLAARAVSYRAPIVLIDPLRLHGAGTSDQAPPLGDDGASPATGLVFRAPTGGRFYGRSAPDKPPFVVPGAQLTQGATICLLEVMKTFSRVTYGGSGLPDTARVVRVLVAEGADVHAGEPLLELE
jgi:acetyl-CoA carboxylase biotin carboxyl carrier protein